jgi:galactokinase
MNEPPSPPTAAIPPLAAEAARQFEQRYQRRPRWIALAPGRVNLIGEHIDYNDGVVLPMAIDRYTAIAAAPGDSPRFRIASREMPDSIDVPAGRISCDGQPRWSAYVLGPLALCQQAGLATGPLDAMLVSDVPSGAGLSSSAALEVATATLAEGVCNQSLGAMNKARLCQQAEHQYAKVPCGIMDQATSAAARRDHLLLLDCQSGQIEQIAMNDPAVSVLVANTNTPHQLVDGQYALRREQCRQALTQLRASSYRELSTEDIAAAAARLEPTLYRRARHVVSEIARTLAAADAIRRRDWSTTGRLMGESHRSLRDDFQVSCAELDTMVELAESLGNEGGVYGTRMTGGGFGGCTVTLVDARHAERIAEKLRQQYQRRTGIEPQLFLSRPSSGSFLAAELPGGGPRDK